MRDSKRIIELGFIERGTGQHESNTVYDSQGLSPCQSATQHKNPTKVIIQKNKCRITKSADSKKLKLLGNLGVGGERGDVFSTNGICPSQSATQYKDAIKILFVLETSIKVAKGNSDVLIQRKDCRPLLQPGLMDIV